MTQPNFLQVQTSLDRASAFVEAHPDLKKQLFNDEGKLRSFVNVYVSDEDIRYLDREKTEVKADDTVSIVVYAGAAGAVSANSMTVAQRQSAVISFRSLCLSAQLAGWVGDCCWKRTSIRTADGCGRRKTRPFQC